jgi:hypothetical protein
VQGVQVPLGRDRRNISASLDQEAHDARRVIGV